MLDISFAYTLMRYAYMFLCRLARRGLWRASMRTGASNRIRCNPSYYCGRHGFRDYTVRISKINGAPVTLGRRRTRYLFQLLYAFYGGIQSNCVNFPFVEVSLNSFLPFFQRSSRRVCWSVRDNGR